MNRYTIIIKYQPLRLLYSQIKLKADFGTTIGSLANAPVSGRYHINNLKFDVVNAKHPTR